MSDVKIGDLVIHNFWSNNELIQRRTTVIRITKAIVYCSNNMRYRKLDGQSVSSSGWIAKAVLKVW